jgi:hypothetical protein
MELEDCREAIDLNDERNLINDEQNPIKWVSQVCK